MINNASYKNSIFNHINRNIVYPTLFYNPITLHHNEAPQTGVEIIEITSSDELNAEEHKSNDQNTTSHIYNTIDNHFTNNNIPEEVNCVRQQQKCNLKRCINSETAFDRACSEFYGINCDNKGSVFSSNQFFSFNSSSSSGTPDALKVTQFSDTSDECWNSDESYNSHKAYDIIKKANKTWNDCRKDIQYLYRNNNSFVIPSQEETSYDNSTDEDELSYRNTINRRAATLPTYMPRLNLPSSPTLPTVAEVFESSQAPINLSEDNDASSLFQKSVNNWFNDDNEIETKENRNIHQSNRLSTIYERETRRTKLKEIQEQDILKENHFKSVNLETRKRYKPLDKIGNIAIQTFLNHYDSATELQKPQIKTNSSSPQSTALSDPKVKSQENCNENSNDSDAIEVFDCDLNTTPEQKNDSIKKEIIENNVLIKTNSNPSDRFSTNCVPPLRFSFIVESDPESRSCLKRILTFIRCCK